MSVKKEQLTTEQLNTTFKEIFEQSDRASAVVSGGILEEILKQMIAAYLVPHPKIKARLFDGMTPISTFSAKIDLAFYLGLINKKQYNDLVIVKKIRNEFAHSIEHIDFDSPKIKDWCKNLHTLTGMSPVKTGIEHIKTAGEHFTINVTLLANHLLVYHSKIKHLKEYQYYTGKTDAGE